MKNLTLLIAVVAIFSFLFSSCKSHEVCPAYGKHVIVKANTQRPA